MPPSLSDFFCQSNRLLTAVCVLNITCIQDTGNQNFSRHMPFYKCCGCPCEKGALPLALLRQDYPAALEGGGL